MGKMYLTLKKDYEDHKKATPDDLEGVEYSDEQAKQTEEEAAGW